MKNIEEDPERLRFRSSLRGYCTKKEIPPSTYGEENLLEFSHCCTKKTVATIIIKKLSAVC